MSEAGKRKAEVVGGVREYTRKRLQLVHSAKSCWTATTMALTSIKQKVRGKQIKVNRENPYPLPHFGGKQAMVSLVHSKPDTSSMSCCYPLCG